MITLSEWLHFVMLRYVQLSLSCHFQILEVSNFFLLLFCFLQFLSRSLPNKFNKASTYPSLSHTSACLRSLWVPPTLLKLHLRDKFGENKTTTTTTTEFETSEIRRWQDNESCMYLNITECNHSLNVIMLMLVW